jgi:hypothetical protein
MECTTRYPDRAARWDNPQSSFHFATERAPLNEHYLSFFVAVLLEFEASRVGHFGTESDDWAWYLVRIDPIEVFGVAQDRQGECPGKEAVMARSDNIMSSIRNDDRAHVRYPIDLTPSRGAGISHRYRKHA